MLLSYLLYIWSYHFLRRKAHSQKPGCNKGAGVVSEAGLDTMQKQNTYATVIINFMLTDLLE